MFFNLFSVWIQFREIIDKRVQKQSEAKKKTLHIHTRQVARIVRRWIIVYTNRGFGIRSIYHTLYVAATTFAFNNCRIVMIFSFFLHSFLRLNRPHERTRRISNFLSFLFMTTSGAITAWKQ